MKVTTTLALLVLVGAGFTLYWFAPTATPDVGSSPAADALAALTPRSITEVRIRRAGEVVAELKRRPGGSWVVDGNWPASPTEVRTLLDALTGLRSRFRGEPDTGEVAPGLQLTVEVRLKQGKHTLTFFERPEADLRYLAPTFVRVDDDTQPLRVTAGLMATLGRPAERYREIQLFPSQRAAKRSAPQERVDLLDARELIVAATGETPVRLVRTADGWEMREPVRDRLDPEAAERLLSAVAELSVRQFAPFTEAQVPYPLYRFPPRHPAEVACQLVDTSAAYLRWQAGLDKPERTLTVTGNDGTVTKLLLGKPLSGDLPPPIPPRGPRPDTFRFAALEGSALLFDLADTRLNDAFVPPGQLRDARLARFSPDDVDEVEVRQGAQTAVLVREGKEAWRMRSPRELAADGERVKDLLGKLSNAEAPEHDRDLLGPARRAERAAAAVGLLGGAAFPAGLLAADLVPPEKLFGLDETAGTVVVRLREKARPDDRDRSRERTLTLRVGKPAGAGGGSYLQARGWPRVDRVEDLSGLVARPAFAYRGRRPLDFKGEDVRRIEVRRPDAGALAGLLGLLGGAASPAAARPALATPLVLERSADGWNLAGLGAAADAIQVSDLADALGKLRVAEYVADGVPAAALQADYGLGTPTLRVRLVFKEAGKAPRELSIGRPRGREAGSFARLDDSADVFALPASFVERLGRPALAYLPATLWQIASDDEVVRYRIARAGQGEYRLVRRGDGWEVGGPFTVAAPPEVVGRLTNELFSPRALEYRAAAVADPAEYGLATPAVKLTLTTAAGKEHALWVGGPTTAGGKPGRFARLGDRGGVFVIGDALARAVDQNALDFLDHTLLRFDPQAVNRVRRSRRGGETLELTRTDDAWQVTKPNERPGDERKIPELIARLGGLRAERVAAYRPKDLGEFGLDAPEATLTVRLADGKDAERVLLVGKEAGPGERFAAVKGGPTVGVLGPEAVRQLLAGPLTFRSHDVARVPDADTIKLEAGERRVTFARPEGTWKVSEPISADAEHEALEAFVSALSRLRADELVAEKPTAARLKAFGLDRPAARWQLLGGDEVKLDLAVGTADRAGRRYARLAGGDLVFLLDPKLSASAVGEYRPRAVWKEGIDPAQVESVAFGHAEGAFELRKVDGAWQVAGKPGVALDDKAVGDTLAVLRDLKLQRYVKDVGAQLKLYGLDPPELKLTVTSPEGTKRLDLGGRAGDTRRRYARVPGAAKGEVFLLDEATSTRLFRDLDGFKKARR